MVFQYLESTLHTLVVATSDKPWARFQVVRNNLCCFWFVGVVSQAPQDETLYRAMCIELATQKGWRRYAFPRFISFILRYLSQTERYSRVLWLI